MRLILLAASAISLALALDEWELRTMAANSMEELDAIQDERARSRAAEMKHYAEQRKLQTGSVYGEAEPLLASASKYGGVPGFYHGVASGSPTTDSVVIWTRYTPVSAEETVLLEFRIAEGETGDLDPSTNADLRRGLFEASPDHDWVAKVDVHGLKAGTSYIFAFVVAGTNEASDVGQTKTAPDGDVDKFRVAVFSCTDFTYGWFHAYDIASTLEDLDMWVHIGDYLYEYGQWYDRPSAERNALLEPTWEQVTLQDYRLRFALYHDDEGLRNIRRRAPMMGIWDDHESTNNPYAWNGVNGTGAQNHQPTCPINETASDADKQSYYCDRDEGDWEVRVNDATKAYFEWLPLRSGDYMDGMGMIEDYDLTQVVEWGNLATVLGVDTRHTVRSLEPTIYSSFFDEYNFAFADANFSDYFVNGTSSNEEWLAANARYEETAWDPQYTIMSDDQFTLTDDVFAASKDAGKPWQLFLSSVMMAPHAGPDPSTAHDLPEAASVRDDFKQYWDDVLYSESGGAWRRIAAAARANCSWNRDGWAGFAAERAEFTDLCKRSANSCVVISGDVHDFWATIIYDQGVHGPGEPVAVNHIAGGVTRTGWGGFTESTYGDAAGDVSLGYDIAEASFMSTNPGMVFAGTKDPGFFVMEMNSTHMITEYIFANKDGKDADFGKSVVSLDNYTVAREGGSLTSPYYCDVSLVSTAGEPGSLEPQADCQVPLMSERPTVWDLEVPAAIVCTSDEDCNAGFRCDLPDMVTCDNVFNCPDEQTRRGRTLKFGYHTADAASGACMPMST